MHTPVPFYGATVLNLPNASLASPATLNISILEALKAGESSIISHPQGSPYPVSEQAQPGGFSSILPWLGLGLFASSTYFDYNPGQWGFNGRYCQGTMLSVNHGAVGWSVAWVGLVLAGSFFLWLLLALSLSCFYSLVLKWRKQMKAS